MCNIYPDRLKIGSTTAKNLFLSKNRAIRFNDLVVVLRRLKFAPEWWRRTGEYAMRCSRRPLTQRALPVVKKTRQKPPVTNCRTCRLCEKQLHTQCMTVLLAAPAPAAVLYHLTTDDWHHLIVSQHNVWPSSLSLRANGQLKPRCSWQTYRCPHRQHH